MKKVIIGAAIAAVLAGPALAQSFQPSSGTGNVVGDSKKPNAGPEIPKDTKSGAIQNNGNLKGTTGSATHESGPTDNPKSMPASK
jgi:hypothetical protein